MTERTDTTKLDQVLASQGRKREWVAQKLGVTYSAVYRWCNGERIIPPARVTELAALLGVHEDEILEPTAQQVRASVA